MPAGLMYVNELWFRFHFRIDTMHVFDMSTVCKFECPDSEGLKVQLYLVHVNCYLIRLYSEIRKVKCETEIDVGKLEVVTS